MEPLTMHRLKVFFFSGLLFAVGCTPPAPLDLKISAKTSDDLQAWTTATLPKIGPELALELRRAIAIQASSSSPIGTTEMDAAWSLVGIDGLSIRELLIRSLSVENKQYYTALLLEESNLERQLSLDQGASKSASDLNGKYIHLRFALIEKYKKLINQNEKRLRDLAVQSRG